MTSLKEKLAEKIPVWREDIKTLLEEHGDTVISQVTVAQAYGGQRGVKCLVCDTSVVDPEKGVTYRGYPIGDLTDKSPAEVFWLLCTGELPSEKEHKSLQDSLRARAEVPAYVWKVLYALPTDTHPMEMLSLAILALERESIFRQRYTEGMHKMDYWEPVLEDSLRLIAKLPSIAAGVYRIRYDVGEPIPREPGLDWGASYAQMLGMPDPDGKFKQFMRLYLTLHTDHEGGNVSANTCHTVGSSLADALGMAGGFSLALLMVGAIREILGSGSLFGVSLFGPGYEPWVIMILPPGGFITVGLLLALFSHVSQRRRQARAGPGMAAEARRAA